MISGRWVEGEKGDGWRTCRCSVGVGLTSPFFGTPFEYNDNWEGREKTKEKQNMVVCTLFVDLCTLL